MKKIKVLILLIIGIFLLSGCRATYNVEIKNNNEFYESIYLFSDNDEEKANIKAYQMPILTDYNESAGSESLEKIEGYSYYDVEKSDGYINFKHTFGLKDYRNSSAVNECFEYFNSAIDEDGNYLLSTSNGITCLEKYPNLSSVAVVIKLDNEVIKNNADSVNGKEYTWHFNNENKDDKSIFLQYKPIVTKSKIEEQKDNTMRYVLITLGILLALLIGYILYNRGKYNKN